MSQARWTQIVTILVLAIALGIAVLRTSALRLSIAAVRPESDLTPQDVVYAMLDAARAGDVANYLGSYTGEMEQSLERARSETDDFAQYLRTSNAPIVGIAVNEPQVLSEREVQIRVEYVFRDRNEIQVLYLGKTSGGWKIARVDSAERIETKTPYGVPIG
jgi:tRNA A37 threonylcarbamoyladenosine modification protein TsaB